MTRPRPPIRDDAPTLGRTTTRRRMLLVPAGLGAALVASRPGHPATAQAAPLRVAVSTGVLADIVANVAGTRAVVAPVMPAGADPHTWEAGPRDVTAVQDADTFVWMGANLERFIESGAWRRAVAEAGIPELVLADHLELIVRDVVIDHGDHTHDLRGGDPHVWLDPLKVVEMLPAIRDHLAGLDPDGADTYRANADGYAARIAAVHDEYVAGLAPLAAERRRLVVFHDAYAYLAARYGFTVVGVVIDDPGQDPSAGEIAALIDTIEREGVPAVFREPQFDAAILDAVAAEIGVVVAELVTDAFAGVVASVEELLRFNLASIITHLIVD